MQRRLRLEIVMTTKNNSEWMKKAKDQESAVHGIRSQFFDDLLQEWSRPPEVIDEIMQQNDGFFAPDFSVKERAKDKSTIMIKDVPRGILAASVTPHCSDTDGVRWVYSVLQAGDWLRYGLLIQGPPKKIIAYDQHYDHLLSIERVWDRQCDHQFRDAGGLLLEWRFHEPDFYDNYACRERFKIIARHLHFRIGKAMAPLFDDDHFDQTMSDEGE